MSEQLPRIEIKGVEEAPSESDALADFRARVGAAVEEALTFLLNDGAPIDSLGETLVVKRLPYKGAFGRDLKIQARANLFFHPTDLARDKALLLKQTFQGCFGLELSDEACKEVEDFLLERLASLEEKFVTEHGEEADREVDIFYYLDEEDVVTDWNYATSLFVHELWHLVENRTGVFRESDLIGEGTATNVQRHFLRETVNRDFTTASGNAMWQLMYFRSSELVEEELGKTEGVGLLNPELRGRIVARFWEELAPEYFAHLAANPTGLDKKQLEDPAYEDFKRDPSKENLLEALRRLGFPQRAQEIEQQDMTSYLDYMQRLLAA